MKKPVRKRKGYDAGGQVNMMPRDTRPIDEESDEPRNWRPRTYYWQRGEPPDAEVKGPPDPGHTAAMGSTIGEAKGGKVKKVIPVKKVVRKR